MMKRENLTPATEDYLKNIYEVTTQHGRASTNQIAEALNVKPASVTGMIQRLAASDPPLVEYRKHRGVILTPDGEKAALETLRHHRLLERFLHEILGFSWDEVHAEADRLEHVISEKFEQRMANVLGHPTHDPHGDPIPTHDLQMPDHAVLCLAELEVGQRAIVKRVHDTDPALLRYLAEIGAVPGAVFVVLGVSDFDDNIEIQIEGQDKHVVLGSRITCEIFVELET
jgi:DtxR family Mn-dependent transcriptional regulator